MAKQSVTLKVNATEKLLLVYSNQQLFKKIPLKGLYEGTMRLEDYVQAITAEALSESRRLAVRRKLKRRRQFA